MKKMFLGLLIGFILALPLNIFADSVVGKAIQTTLPFFVNGQQASTDAIVVQGSSYVPLRTAGTMFGYNVNYADGKITLESKTKQVGSDETVSYYFIKSNSIKIGGRGEQAKVLMKDSNYYLILEYFGPYAIWDGTNVTITINNTTIIINRNQKYSKDINGFIDSGMTYVNPNALNLTATIDGDTMWLETN